MDKGYTYQDIYLLPRHSTVKSRSDVDVSVEFLGRKFNLPVIPANMSSVLDRDIARELSEKEYFYIYHRFDNNEEFVRQANEQNWKLISISIGVQQVDYDFIDELVRRRIFRVDFITIDIAHGNCDRMKGMIQYLKKYRFTFGNPKIIAGNVAEHSAVWNLTEWGADAAKVGIAGGAVCSTKTQTGFYVPMYSSVKDCVDYGSVFNADVFGEKIFCKSLIPIIADGGIKDNGDIAKALSLGALMVMAGSIFAACEDAPGESIIEDPEFDCEKITHKRYFGSASAKQKGSNKHVEGFETLVRCNGLTFEQKLNEIKESLQSACSYAGSYTISGLKDVKHLTIK